MNSISGLMKEYFSGGRPSLLREGLPRELPISPKKAEWRMTSGSDALIRTFEFKSEKKLRLFVNEILRSQQESGHHAQILIEEKTVKIRVTTHALNRVTELDTEYAARTDQIFEEVEGLMENES
jgi:pterin-4a-carbinolamine dehydratase